MKMLDGDISIGMFRFEVIVCRNPLLNKTCTMYIEDVNSFIRRKREVLQG